MIFADTQTICTDLSKLPSKELLEQQQREDAGSWHTKLPEQAARNSQLGQRQVCWSLEEKTFAQLVLKP